MITFTIAAKNYLHYALTLRETFLVHNPDKEFVIILLDALESLHEVALLRNLSNKNIIGFWEIRNIIPNDKLEEMLIKYNCREMATAIKPFVFDYFFKKGHDQVVYLDPDIQVFGNFDSITTHNAKKIIITPHVLNPYPNDGKIPNELSLLRAGIYNLGFLSLKSCSEVDRLLSWWKAKLQEHCFENIDPTLFVDQKWFDFIPSFFENVTILKHPGYNVAYWNYHERTLWNNDGRWHVNGGFYPLIFFHFSGIQLDDSCCPTHFSKHQNRFDLSNDPKLGDILAAYAGLLKKNGFDLYRNLSYYYDKIPGTGKSIDFIRDSFKSQSPISINILRPDSEIRNNFSKGLPDGFGINIIGYFRNPSSSLCVNAHQFLRKIQRAGVPFALAPLWQEEPFTSLGQFEYYCSLNLPFNTSFFFVNADQLPFILKNASQLGKKTNVLFPWWEIEGRFPYNESFNHISDVVAQTEFMERILRKFAPNNVMVHRLKYPFCKDWDISISRQETRRILKVDNTETVFLNAFDFKSGYRRKNPEGVIDAFQMAFRPGDSVKLIFKVNPGSYYDLPNLFEKINGSSMRNHIKVINQYLSRNELASLLNACDCLVSLHRSEGCGLLMLEAMSMGKPVIATAYGGNLDFMHETNAFLVDYKQTQVKEAFLDFYKPDDVWAEPDINDAASKMASVYCHPEIAAILGSEAKFSIRKYSDDKQFTKAFYDLMIKLAKG